MKLIVASTKAVTHVDVRKGKVTNLNNLLGVQGWYPYGITWSKKNLFMGIHSVDPGHVRKIVSWDKDLKPAPGFSFGNTVFWDVHQIQWYDGRLWVVSSGLNQVIIIDPPNKFTRWVPNPNRPPGRRKPGHDPRDWNHFNSIWFEKNRVYLVAHNYEWGSEVWEFTYPGRKLVKIHKQGFYSHNVCRIKGKLVNLSSTKAGRIKLGEKDEIAFGFGRGLAVGKKIFVGSSAFQKDREKRVGAKDGEILVYNQSLKLVKRISVPYGDIREIRILDEPDLAHHGQPWTGRSFV